jgi:branched-chain amino acid transport system substrate-binding protein
MRNIVAASTAALALVALSACSASGGSGSSGKGSTITIGLPFPLTGAWADGGQNSANGAKLAIADVNAAGGIKALDGAKFKGVTADTGSTNPGQASTATRQLIQQDGASAIVGAYVSAFTTTASTTAEQAGVPLVTAAYADTLSQRGYKNFFQDPPTSTAIGADIVPYVKDAYQAIGKSVSDVAVLASNDASISVQGQTAIKEASQGGLKVVYKNFYPDDISDPTVMVQAALKANPDVIFLGGPTDAAVSIVNTIRTLGYKGPIVGLGGGGILDPQFGKQLGNNVNGILSQAGWNWDLPYEGLSKVADEYKAKYGTFMPQEAGEAYVAVWEIAGAIESAKSSKPAEISKALHSMDFNSGPASFMPGGEVVFDDKGLNTKTMPILIQWQDGAPRTVWPQAVQAAKPQ